MKAVISIVLLLIIPMVVAEDLKLEKLVDEKEVFTNAKATVLLKFTNPFNTSIPIKIVDKNIIGNNGVDVQCIEYDLPQGKDVVLQYEPIKPFQEGKFTLDKAKVTYTNPITKKESTVESNTLDITVKKGNSSQEQASGITTIYRCDGQNIQSTSYSSSSMGPQVNENSAQQQQEQKSAQQAAKVASQQVQNNQMPQDSNALKNQMQKDMQANDVFKNNLQSNPDFQKLQQEMADIGFKETKSSINPDFATSGSFEMDYQNQNGTTAKIAGNMANGTIKDVKKTFDDNANNKKGTNYALYAVIFLGILVISILVAKRFYAKLSLPAKAGQKDEEIDYFSLASQMIEEAKVLWKNKEEKESYAKVSYAIRFYHMHKHKLKELTSTDLVKFLKSFGHAYSDVLRCLNLCGQVEFAKYKPNDEDFNEILGLANRIIKKNK